LGLGRDQQPRRDRAHRGEFEPPQSALEVRGQRRECARGHEDSPDRACSEYCFNDLESLAGKDGPAVGDPVLADRDRKPLEAVLLPVDSAAKRMMRVVAASDSGPGRPYRLLLRRGDRLSGMVRCLGDATLRKSLR